MKHTYYHHCISSFWNGLIQSCSSIYFYFKSNFAEVSHKYMKISINVICFPTFGAFFSKFIFLRLWCFSSLLVLIQSIQFITGSTSLWNLFFFIKHFYSQQPLLWLSEKYVFQVFVATIFREKNSFIKIIQLINQNYCLLEKLE